MINVSRMLEEFCTDNLVYGLQSSI